MHSPGGHVVTCREKSLSHAACLLQQQLKIRRGIFNDSIHPRGRHRSDRQKKPPNENDDISKNLDDTIQKIILILTQWDWELVGLGIRPFHIFHASICISLYSTHLYTLVYIIVYRLATDDIRSLLLRAYPTWDDCYNYIPLSQPSFVTSIAC